jgi:hypothetical protein
MPLVHQEASARHHPAAQAGKLAGVRLPTVSTPLLHKGEVVAAYIAEYGDPEAPDYNLEESPR